MLGPRNLMPWRTGPSVLRKLWPSDTNSSYFPFTLPPSLPLLNIRQESGKLTLSSRLNSFSLTTGELGLDLAKSLKLLER